MQGELTSIRKLLIVIVVTLGMYILHILSVILIPLTIGLFSALIFTPLMRWFSKKKVPVFFGIIAVLMIVAVAFGGAYKIVKQASMELTNVDDDFIHSFKDRLNKVAKPIATIMKVETKGGESDLSALLNNDKITANLFQNIGSGINMVKDVLTIFLMSLFFMVLFLAGSVNIKQILDVLVFKEKEDSTSTYQQIEKDILTFIFVKLLMSLITGICVGLTCFAFGISFPVFWATIAFLFNFIQLIGSLILVIGLAFFALVELDISGVYLFFVIAIVSLQVLIGAVIEPILLGKSFSINTITILVMLTVWGVVWGIPGIALSIPITALLKKILDKSPNTLVYSKIMS